MYFCMIKSAVKFFLCVENGGPLAHMLHPLKQQEYMQDKSKNTSFDCLEIIF